MHMADRYKPFGTVNYPFYVHFPGILVEIILILSIVFSSIVIFSLNNLSAKSKVRELLMRSIDLGCLTALRLRSMSSWGALR